MYKKYFGIIIIIAVLMGCASLKDTVHFGSLEISNDNTYVKVTFSDRDKIKIKEYYSLGRKGKKKIPPGLAKKGNIPPGLQKRLACNQKLPPGFQKKVLPSELEKELTALPQGYGRFKIGADVVIMDQKTNIIVDIVYGIDS